MIAFWLFFPYLHEEFTGYRYLLQGFFVILVLSGAFAVSNNKTALFIALGFLALIILLIILRNHYDSENLLYVIMFVQICYLLYLTTLILYHVLSVNIVNAEKIYGALCAYLLLGIIWGMSYFLIAKLSHNAFYISNNITVVPHHTEHYQRELINFIYYSFVTFTTLGYGDIHPLNGLARAFSSLEAVIGQFYTAVLIARIVGIHIAQSVTSRDE